MTLSDNQKVGLKKTLPSFGFKVIITSLPAAASNSDCRRRSHPDCRATGGAANLMRGGDDGPAGDLGRGALAYACQLEQLRRGSVDQ